MSWLSEITGIHISAPPVIQHLGDVAGGFLVNNIPGGGVLNSTFNILNQRQGGPTLPQLAAQTAANVSQNVSTGVYAAGQAAALQQQSSQLSTGLQLITGSPLGLALLAGVAYLALRKR